MMYKRLRNVWRKNLQMSCHAPLAYRRSLLPRVSPLYPWLTRLPFSSYSSSLGPWRPPLPAHGPVGRVDLPDRPLERLVEGDVGRQVGVGGRGVDGKAPQ